MADHPPVRGASWCIQRPSASRNTRSINARLKAAGIAVAFPQMDIHVRDLPPAPAAPQEAPGA